MVNYYRILGVDANADRRTIKTAYRKLAKEFHPDVNRHDPHAEQLFQRVAEAYNVLSDKDERASYDRHMRQQSISRAQPKQGQATYSHNIPQQEAWQRYLNGFETKAKPASLTIWQDFPWVHRILVLGALVAVAIISTLYAQDGLQLLAPILVFITISTGWVYRMQNSLLTSQKRPAVIEIVLIYFFSLLITTVLTFPFIMAVILS